MAQLPPKYFGHSRGPVEDIRRYCKGGFHPIHIGDTLRGRFKVVDKLGHGRRATVWLCRDLQLEKWVAIKVLASFESAISCADLMLPNHFRVPAPKPELEYFCFLLEHFWATGPNGAHICIVLPLLGPSIAHATDYFFDQPFVLKSVCRQMALAMHLLHSRNICHG
ncbi:kinase-like protein, partial [Canariomyces notabilis]